MAATAQCWSFSALFTILNFSFTSLTALSVEVKVSHSEPVITVEGAKSQLTHAQVHLLVGAKRALIAE